MKFLSQQSLAKELSSFRLDFSEKKRDRERYEAKERESVVKKERERRVADVKARQIEDRK